MQTLPSTANPFALMVDPAAIFAKIAHSERLERLQRHICRPLDKPLLPLDPAIAAADAADALDALDVPDVDDAGTVFANSAADVQLS